MEKNLLRKYMKRVTNNKYPNCPALMADGRQFTDYRSNRYVNSLLRMKYGTPDQHQYRNFLMENSDVVRQETDQYYNNMLKCDCNAKPTIQAQYLCKVGLNYSRCTLQDPDGIGTEYKGMP